MAYTVKNKKKTLKESVENLIGADVRKEINISELKQRIKEEITGKKMGIKKDSIPGLAVTAKVHKQAGKDNRDGVDAILQKIKDYLKFENNSNPEFPHQNNSKTDYKSPMYRNSTDQEEYIDTWRGGGLSDLEYDTEPSDQFKERFGKYLDGSSETGNAQVDENGDALGNVVPSELGKKIQKTLKSKHKKLQGADGYAIPNDWTQHPNPGFIPESNKKKGKLIKEQTSILPGEHDFLKAKNWEAIKVFLAAHLEKSKKLSKDIFYWVAAWIKKNLNKVSAENIAYLLKLAYSHLGTIDMGTWMAGLAGIGGKIAEYVSDYVSKQGIKIPSIPDNPLFESRDSASTTPLTEGVKQDIDSMNHLFTYKKKTQ